jgi:hypothetical protein
MVHFGTSEGAPRARAPRALRGSPYPRRTSLPALGGQACPRAAGPTCFRPDEPVPSWPGGMTARSSSQGRHPTSPSPSTRAPASARQAAANHPSPARMPDSWEGRSTGVQGSGGTARVRRELARARWAARGVPPPLSRGKAIRSSRRCEPLALATRTRAARQAAQSHGRASRPPDRPADRRSSPGRPGPSRPLERRARADGTKPNRLSTTTISRVRPDGPLDTDACEPPALRGLLPHRSIRWYLGLGIRRSELHQKVPRNSG